MKTKDRYSTLCFVALFCLGQTGFAQHGGAEGQEVIAPQQLWLNPSDMDFRALEQQIEAYYADKDKGSGSGYKQWYRWAYKERKRLLPNGKMTNWVDRNLSEFSRYSLTHQSADRSNTGNWTAVGPYDCQQIGAGLKVGVGRINCMTFHPTDPNTFWAGAPAGGLWKTIDMGNNWTPLTDGIPSCGVSGIAVNPENPDIIYIMTGDGDAEDTRSSGVLKTFNGGNTWYSTGLSWPIDVPVGYFGYKLVMDPRSPDTLLAATSVGLYRTTDGGVSWIRTFNSMVFDIEFKPDDPDVIYLSTTTNVWRSEDNGITWFNMTPSLMTGATRVAISVTEGSPNMVYALAGPHTDSLHFVGLFLSNDAGLNFIKQSDSPNILGNSNDGNSRTSQTWYDHALATSPSTPSKIYTGGINVWSSDNFGFPNSWQNVSQWSEYSAATVSYCHADIHNIDFSPHDESLFVCSDGGLFRSVNGGTSFDNLSAGMNITQIYNIDNYEGVENLMIIGTQDNGTNFGDATGDTWNKIKGGDGTDCVFSHTDPNTMFFTSNNSVHRTTNGGFSSTRLKKTKGWPAVEMHPTNSQRIYFSDSDIFQDNCSVYASDDNGTTFYACGDCGGASTLKSGINDPSILYSASHYQFFAFDDANIPASNWPAGSCQNLSFLPYNGNLEVTEIAVNPANALQVAVVVSGYSAGDKVFRSLNRGVTWENISGTLPNIPFHSIVWMHGGSSGLYVGADVGVYYRDDALGDWMPFRNGLPNAPIFDLTIHQTSGMLRAATYGRGIWESPLYTSCTNDQVVSGSQPIYGYTFLQADQTITSSQQFDGGVGTSVVYHAGQSITLAQGFEVKQNSKFHGLLRNCNTQPVQSAIVNDVIGTYAGPLPMVVDEVTDVASIDSDGYFNLFPNPSSDWLNIEFSSNTSEVVEIHVTDLSGKFIESILGSSLLNNGTYRMTLDVTKFAAGSYICTLRTGKNQQSKLFIVK